MSTPVRTCLLSASGVMAVGAVLHLWAIAAGPAGYAVLGAPAGLIALLDTGSLRPAASCVVIALALALASAYGLSAAGVGPRLPLRQPALGVIAIGLILRGLLLPLIAALRPELLRGICGQCQSVNGFVLSTSLLCLVVGGGYALGALRYATAARAASD